jgi:hypothetical protein
LAEGFIAVSTVAYLPRMKAFWQAKEAPDDAFRRLALHDLVWGRQPAAEIGARATYRRATGGWSPVCEGYIPFRAIANPVHVVKVERRVGKLTGYHKELELPISCR